MVDTEKCLERAFSILVIRNMTNELRHLRASYGWDIKTALNELAAIENKAKDGVVEHCELTREEITNLVDNLVL